MLVIDDHRAVGQRLEGGLPQLAILSTRETATARQALGAQPGIEFAGPQRRRRAQRTGDRIAIAEIVVTSTQAAGAMPGRQRHRIVQEKDSGVQRRGRASGQRQSR